MEAILKGYEVNEPTWFYLSFLLIIAIFFRFRRFWSLRNLDLLLLLMISPGVLLVRSPGFQSGGYVWLFTISGLWLARCLFDRLFDKRPKFEPNLNNHGLVFLLVCVFGFLTIRAIRVEPNPSAIASVREAEQLFHQQSLSDESALPPVEYAPETAGTGPTVPLVTAPVVRTSRSLVNSGVISVARLDDRYSVIERIAVRLISILSHLSVVLGLFFIGRNIFNDSVTGLTMATIYLLLPCTAYYVGEINQVLPSAFLIWALALHAHPIWSGLLLGLACGTMLFPVFALPVWMSYVGRKKMIPFAGAFLGTGALLLATVYFSSPDTLAFTQQTVGAIDLRFLSFDDQSVQNGFWTSFHPAWRIPMMSAFVVLVVLLSIWPLTKNYEVLISHTAAIIVATQFWYPQQGGVYVLWYLPALLLMVFRPKMMPNVRNSQNTAILKTTRGSYEYGSESKENAAAPHLSQKLL